MPKDKDNGFDEYKHLILDRLQDFKDCRSGSQYNFTKLHESIDDFKDIVSNKLGALSAKVDHIDKRMVVIEVKSGLWGGLLGGLTGILPLLLSYFNHK